MTDPTNPPTPKQRLEAHAAACRAAIAAGKARPTLPADCADLAGADLAGAYLADANLARADLARAYLADADLARADLAGANLAGANLARADLADAYLADAYLAGANLARADLAGAIGLAPGSTTDATTKTREEWLAQRATNAAARAQRYRKRHPDVPVVDRLDSKILAVVECGSGKLDMSSWHTCETTHCRAGWAITLAGEAGKALEEKVGSRAAGAAIYRASTGRSPHFFATNENAMADIRRCAAEECK